MTQQETARIIAAICASFPGRIPAQQIPEMVAVWTDLLDDVPYPLASSAIKALLQVSRWPPTPAEIRSTAAELELGPVPAGLEAWGWVIGAISRWGSYRSPGVDFVIPDPVTARVVDALGWQHLCLSENQAADRARFIEAYDTMAGQARKEVQSPVLRAARDNRQVTAGSAISNVIGILGQGDK